MSLRSEQDKENVGDLSQQDSKKMVEETVKERLHAANRLFDGGWITQKEFQTTRTSVLALLHAP